MSSPVVIEHRSVQTEDDSIEKIIEVMQYYCDKILAIVNQTMRNGDIVLPTHFSKLRKISNKMRKLEKNYTQYFELG